jgi:protein-export membrane protein SecD
MRSLKRVIERRVNVFGVSQPIVQAETTGIVAGGDASHRLIVELPGVTDIEKATNIIGDTPVLEFKLRKKGAPPVGVEGVQVKGEGGTTTVGTSSSATSTNYEDTGLTGRYLENAEMRFSQQSGQPFVSLQFNDKGAEMFAQITDDNVGETLAIFLDGEPISQPVIQTAIRNGEARITGNFSGADGREEARELANDLKFGALPVPIELINTQSVGPTLGAATLDAGVSAGIIGFMVLSLFLVLWYRIQGIVSVGALVFYVLIMLVLFKLIPVTLTSAGIAGFILSVGMAVDANVLIFERIKEERRHGYDLIYSITNGFARAWPSIRDANISSIISAIILYWMGTSIVKGFALVFGLGVLVSMVTAISVTRTFLLALARQQVGRVLAVAFGTGVKRY